MDHEEPDRDIRDHGDDLAFQSVEVQLRGTRCHQMDASECETAHSFTPCGNNDLQSSFAQLEAAAITVTNDDGRWVGTGRGIVSNDAALGSAAFGDVVWFHLQGEGAYEGMSAYLTTAVARKDVARGFIFADQLPPFPEPAE